MFGLGNNDSTTQGCGGKIQAFIQFSLGNSQNTQQIKHLEMMWERDMFDCMILLMV